MATRNVNFVSLLLVLCVLGITTTVCSCTEDATDAHQFESAIRPNYPGWYRDGMKLFEYRFNEWKWHKKEITWAIMNESEFVTEEDMVEICKKSFEVWSAVIPKDFTQVSSTEQPDIRISFNPNYKFGIMAFTYYPEDTKVMDYEGGQIDINDTPLWDREYRKCCISLPHIMLHEVGHILGLDHSNVRDTVMHWEAPITRNFDPYRLTDDDLQGIQELYGKRCPQDEINTHMDLLYQNALKRKFEDSP